MKTFIFASVLFAAFAALGAFASPAEAAHGCVPRAAYRPPVLVSPRVYYASPAPYGLYGAYGYGSPGVTYGAYGHHHHHHHH